jgi:thymidylate synthase
MDVKDGPRTEKEWMDYVLGLRNKKVLYDEYNKRSQQGLMGTISSGGKGNIPVLYAKGNGLAQAWENAMICLWNKGGFVRTEYDGKDKETGLFIVGPSMDSTMHWVIENPLAEPMIHRDFPGGLSDLEEYRQEVLEGIKDNWIRDPTNPEDHRWEYTYHERMFNYKVPGVEQALDQFEIVMKNLAKSPITRRAQIVSWKPWEDSQIGDPACFQSDWVRILREHPEFELYSDEKTGVAYLNANIRFRSWDSYRGSGMNMFAFTLLNKKMAKGISEIRGEEVKLGRISCVGDSYHIYYKDFKDFLGMFATGLEKRHFAPTEDYDQEARTWNLNSELTQMCFAEAQDEIKRKVAEQNAKYAQGKDLTKKSAKLLGE